MAVEFRQDRWQEVRENARAWWNGELKRPLIQFAMNGRDPGRPEPGIPSHLFQAFYDESVSAEEVIDRVDYDLSCKKFQGDAFPMFYPSFGAGVVAAFLGSLLDTSVEHNTCWFRPSEPKHASTLQFEYDSENSINIRGASSP